MQVSCIFRHRPVSEKARFYAEHKIRELLNKFVPNPMEIDLFFETIGNYEQIRLHLIADKYFTATLSAQGIDLYNAVDELVEKLKKFLRRKKDRLKHHKTLNGKTKRLKFVTAASQGNEEKQVSIDAEELVKFERARKKLYGGRRAGHSTTIRH